MMKAILAHKVAHGTIKGNMATVVYDRRTYHFGGQDRSWAKIKAEKHFAGLKATILWGEE